jgi:hypothetical protein
MLNVFHFNRTTVQLMNYFQPIQNSEEPKNESEFIEELIPKLKIDFQNPVFRIINRVSDHGK